MRLAIRLLFPKLKAFHELLERYEYQEVLDFKLPVRKLKHQVADTLKELEEICMRWEGKINREPNL